MATKTSLILFFVCCLPFISISSKNPPVDSVSIILKKNWPVEKKIIESLKFVYRIAATFPDYSVRSSQKVLQMAKENKNALGIARAHFAIGYSYAARENFVIALDYYFKALPVFERKQDTSLILGVCNNIGIAYSQQDNHENAAKYFKRVIDLSKSEYSRGISYNNIGIEYQKLKKYTLSDRYLKLSYAIFLKMEKHDYLTYSIMNRGVIRFDKGMYDSALIMYRLAYQNNLKFNKGIYPESIYNNIGETFYKLGLYDSAEYYLNKTLQTIDTLNDRYTLRETYKHISEVYDAKNKSEKALFYYKKYNQLNTLIFSDENLKKTISSEANFKLLQKENELTLSEETRKFDKKRNNLIYVFISVVGLLLCISLVIVIFRFKEKKKANSILTDQKNKIQHQAKEITDSINYAQRIQDSILPSTDVMRKVLNEYLLFYLPRDIVGGDFYFVEEVNGRKYFAAIDCTGHGVPGGFMSMLGYNGIQNALLDLKFIHPAEILENLSANISTHFTQEGKNILRDGMDMALCCLYTKEGKHMLEFAGAHNPCWIVKHTANEIIELNANKQPVGFFEDHKPFTNHILEVQKGDTIYLFTDGYPDQFGGPLGKKFKYSQLKSILLQNPSLNLAEREQLLKKMFQEWKSHYDQLDDVCILGVRV